MSDLDFVFEQTAWEAAYDVMAPDGELDAVRFMSLMEGEPEEALEAAFQDLEDKRIFLDLSNLPMDWSAGTEEDRLRLEDRLVRQGLLPEGLEENDPLRLYLEELAGLPMPCIQPEALAQRCLEGNDAAMQMLANCYLGQVVTQAQSLTGHGVLLLDLIQEGSLGLWQGLLRYTGGGIDGYARRWIRQSMAKTVIRQALAHGVGQRLKKALEDYRAADLRLLTRLGRNPTIEEAAQELGITAEEAALVEKQMRTVQAAARRKEPLHSEDSDKPVEDTAYFQSRRRIGELLSGLESLEARVLTMRFGLEDGKPRTVRQTGEALGLTAEEVDRIEADALEKLRGSN